eukprot:14681768-Alexandrium_andersonii.AAC.1
MTAASVCSQICRRSPMMTRVFAWAVPSPASRSLRSQAPGLWRSASRGRLARWIRRLSLEPPASAS